MNRRRQCRRVDLATFGRDLRDAIVVLERLHRDGGFDVADAWQRQNAVVGDIDYVLEIREQARSLPKTAPSGDARHIRHISRRLLATAPRRQSRQRTRGLGDLRIERVLERGRAIGGATYPRR